VRLRAVRQQAGRKPAAERAGCPACDTSALAHGADAAYLGRMRPIPRPSPAARPASPPAAAVSGEASLPPQAGEQLASHAPLSMTGFVLIAAALMGMNALATDIMLPGMPNIAADLGVANTTEVQPVISIYLLGFGFGQLFVGLLADRFGRRPLLLTGTAIYFLASLAAFFVHSLEALLIIRAIQGAGSAAPRVVTTAVVRDCYRGRPMARVMSLAMMAFMAAPIIAPTLGQITLMVADWRWIFALLALYGFALLVICARSFPETLPPERRVPLRLRPFTAAFLSVVGNRQTIGYTLAAGSLLGAMFGYLNSAQQVMVEVLGLGDWFAGAFALMATGVAVSSLVNAGLVERLGMRLLSHLAATLFTILAVLILALETAGLLGAAGFIAIMMALMLLLGLIFANFNALAMEPQGRAAGLASSLIGAITTMMAAVIGFFIGQAFDGSVAPLATGYTICGLAAIAIILLTERGRMFHPGAQGR